MLLKLDKDSLSTLNSNLKIEVENYNNTIDNILKDLDSLNNVWKGEGYNNFYRNVEKNIPEIIKSKQILSQYQQIIENSLINYNNLSEGIHYNE